MSFYPDRHVSLYILPSFCWGLFKVICLKSSSKTNLCCSISVRPGAWWFRSAKLYGIRDLHWWVLLFRFVPSLEKKIKWFYFGWCGIFLLLLFVWLLHLLFFCFFFFKPELYIYLKNTLFFRRFFCWFASFT